jgi:hypothetical protein
MKKKITIFLVTLLSLLLTISSVYALDEKNTSDSVDYSKVINERLVLHDDNKIRLYNRYEYDVKSYMTMQNTPEFLVNDIQLDFSINKETKPFKFSEIDFELPSTLSEIAQVGAAFLTNLVVHEVGHAIVAEHVGAEGNRLNFFNKEGDTFFLGTSTVKRIDKRSKLSYTMGGEFAADLTFEHALKSYRKNPTVYNRSLVFFSGIDFLWYCFYAFYLTEGNSHFDPVTISEETGISKDALFSIALAKTLINAYRYYSGEDRVIPYFIVDRYSASLNIGIPF